MTDFRVSYTELGPLVDGNPVFRVLYSDANVVQDTGIVFHLNYSELHQVQDRTPLFFMNYIEIQSIVAFRYSPWYDADTEGSDMSTEIFPELMGLTFDIKRRPMFSNKVQSHVSGKETRLSYWEEPKWEFELAYDFVPNVPKEVGYTDLERIMGFFLQRKGDFQSFLYRFQDDFRAVGSLLGQGTGTNAEFTFRRSIGPWRGAVDYVDQSAVPPVLYWDYTSQPYTIGTGPYTVAAPPYLSDPVAVIGGPLTRIPSGSPGINEYTLNETSGLFTFNSGRSGQTVYITARRTMQEADYEITIPNIVVFNNSPPATVTVRSTFNYYYAVRFGEGEAEFNLFYDKLYELQQLTLKSIIV